MLKRFSAREFGLLMAPIIVIGAAGFWVSKKMAADKPHFEFHVEKPTPLEAFNGADAVFVIDFDKQPKPYFVDQLSRYLELKTPRGTLISYPNNGNHSGWDKGLWRGSGVSDSLRNRQVLSLKSLPAGEIYYGAIGLADSNFWRNPRPIPSPTDLRLTGRWKIDRAQIKAPNLAAMPQNPKVRLLEVKISGIGAAPPPINKIVTGEATFGFEDAAMNDQTPLKMKLSSPAAEMNSWTKVQIRTSRKPHQRTTSWDVSPLNIPNPRVRISGRVSADNRWSLGFEIEPFDFKNAKVGQKLRFKQFPVALPKD